MEFRRVLFRSAFGDLSRRQHIAAPAREVKIIAENQEVERLDWKDDVALHGLEPEQLLRRIGGRRTQQLPEPLEGLPGKTHGAASLNAASSAMLARVPQSCRPASIALLPRSRKRAFLRPGR